MFTSLSELMYNQSVYRLATRPPVCSLWSVRKAWCRGCSYLSVDTDSSRGLGSGTTNSLRHSMVWRLLVEIPLVFRNRLPSPSSIHSHYVN